MHYAITYPMNILFKYIPCKEFLKRSYRKIQMLALSGDAVQCPICEWQGSRFMDGSWHKRAICPQCEADIRHRLIMASFRYLLPYRSETFLAGKKILHFAPEQSLEPFFRQITDTYVTADLYWQPVDIQIDISDMGEISAESYDIVIASDVLEHVVDYQRAIREIHRILRPGGTALLTVPQKDNLSVTYENPAITDPHERTKAFGEPTHLRIFGTDFTSQLISAGFLVNIVNAQSFEENLISRHVLKPPVLSQHPLATNYRNLFFCSKTQGQPDSFSN